MAARPGATDSQRSQAGCTAGAAARPHPQQRHNIRRDDRCDARALELKPDFFEAFHTRGLVRAAQGNLAAARADLEHAIGLYQAESNTRGERHARADLAALPAR
jgi:regulator of sirC expression with transglutaminase-like and TPR domain